MTRFAIKFSWLKWVLGAVERTAPRKSWLDRVFWAKLRVRMGCILHADRSIVAAIVDLKGIRPRIRLDTLM